MSDLTPENLSSIGKPIRNVDRYLIDDSGKSIDTPGVVGELCFSGVALSPGYWNRPEQTEAAFVRLKSLDDVRCYRTGDKAKLDENGDLHFLGRLDNQIKLRGFRIELDEIANNLMQHRRVKNAIATKSAGNRPALVSFAVVDEINGDEAQLQTELLEFLRTKMPHYMVPQAIAIYERFPVTIGGKVDVPAMVEALGSMDQDDSADAIDGLSVSQQQVLEVWKSVLGHAPRSIDDSFEQSGGDSLAAMALAMELEKAFPTKRFGVSTFLSYPTVRKLADYASAAEGDAGSQGSQGDLTSPIITSIGRRIDDNVDCLILFHPGGGSGYLYDSILSSDVKEQYAVLIVESPLLTSEIPDSISETVSTIAQKYADDLTEMLGAGRDIVTAGYSFGGLLAIEVARLFEQNGHRIKRVINLDQPPSLIGHESKMPQRIKNWVKRLRYPYLTLQDLRLARHQRGIKRAAAQEASGEISEEARSELMKDYYAEIEDQYSPTPFQFELCLIRGDVFEAKYDLPEDYGWSKVAVNLSAHRISGTHSTLFMGRHHGRLAKTFDELVRAGFRDDQ